MSGQNKTAFQETGKVVVEALGNIKTVASHTLEEHFLKDYFNILKPVHNAALRQSHLSAFLYSFGNAILYFDYALAFYYAAHLVEDREITFGAVMKVISCMIMCSNALGQTSALAPDFGKARTASQRILSIVDSETSLNAALDIGCKPAEGTFKPEICFQDVNFTYKSRPNIKILQDFNATIKHGQSVALVGTSGCGKSTVLSLLERFYSYDSGNVFLDKYNIEDLNIQWFRSQMGLVSQEPNLFNTSVTENIAYGDNSRVIGMDEIIKAAKNANIHNFIEALPDGYDTNVGDGGTQLSGGQKQRIAIARALVREPKILLLDEATSALDTESEKIVQEALDKAKKGRTCIVIAHRLSTIVNSDNILVIDKGAVAEQGTHRELMAKKGLYFRLHRIQHR